MGRTARGFGASGNAVLLLRPEEREFVDYLQEAKIYLDKYEMWDKLSNLQSKVSNKSVLFWFICMSSIVYA